MADLTITAANVVKGSGAILEQRYLAGESVTAGMGVYQKSSDSRWWKSQCDGTAEESGVGVLNGIALHASAAGQPLTVQTGGTITIGATTAVGTVYAVSATAGSICPIADVGSGKYVSVIGYGATTTTITMSPIVTGVQVP